MARLRQLAAEPGKYIASVSLENICLPIRLAHPTAYTDRVIRFQSIKALRRRRGGTNDHGHGETFPDNNPLRSVDYNITERSIKLTASLCLRDNVVMINKLDQIYNYIMLPALPLS